ncbi:MAG: hypothetical protein A2136_00540 [Chloroflexi bacterium RBG_16_54_11]|nr:MAG: hypothetical protein A2136_00540 [Chloroflexi bacterium RBG_16_54_11]
MAVPIPSVVLHFPWKSISRGIYLLTMVNRGVIYPPTILELVVTGQVFTQAIDAGRDQPSL